MPDCRRAIPFFIVFGRSAMGFSRKLVQLGRSPVFFVHGVPPGFYQHEAVQISNRAAAVIALVEALILA